MKKKILAFFLALSLLLPSASAVSQPVCAKDKAVVVSKTQSSRKKFKQKKKVHLSKVLKNHAVDLAKEFDLPVGIFMGKLLKKGQKVSYDFKKNASREYILRRWNDNRWDNKSKRLFGKETKKTLSCLPDAWHGGYPEMRVGGIRHVSGNYYDVTCHVYWYKGNEGYGSQPYGGKLGTVKIRIKRKKTAVHHFVATKITFNR